MYILGIETSCDETAIAIAKDNRILADSVSSSVHLHKDFGGVIPEIASRYHVEYINHVLKSALSKAKITLDKIDLIAVTRKPGLVGALLVGISMAKALSLSNNIPIIGVDHLLAHLYAAFMEGERPIYPFIGLVVSGGHTNLFFVDNVNKYKLLGQTLDDAAGEAFDKVAKLLNLGYPGGPVIQKRAANGEIDKTLFPRSSLDGTLNFSFSGIKTAVLYHLRDRLKHESVFKDKKIKADNISRLALRLKGREIDNIAASFQDAVTEILVEKAVIACRYKGVRRLILGGGVTANTQLRKKLSARALEYGIKLMLPSKKLCLDNAAMVAGLGGALYKKGVRSDLYFTAQSTGNYP
jgi:N6-L-threonylcarbamoyladenine synthase